MQVFGYADANAAKADAARVSPNGNSIGTPHFFQSDKLVVLYVGDGKTVQDALARQLGAQFAGK